MSSWLSRAKEALSGREAEIAPVPIEVACPCGRKVEAMRHTEFQRVLCQGCSEPFFLLPLDVYPRPVMKVRKVKPSKTAEPAQSKSSGKSAAPPEAATTRTPIDLRAKRQEAFARVRTQFTPLRLIVLSLLAVIGLTGWWQWNRAARSSAEVDFKTATAAGMEALRKPDFVEAAQHFGRAAAAADLLQRSDVAAEQTRQRFRQLTALNSLLTRSLFEVVDAARATRLRENVLAAESEFTNLHAGRWIVLQSEVLPPPDPAGSTTVPWEQRIQIFDEPLILTANLPVFAKVQATATLTPATPEVPPVNAPDSVSALNDLGQREVTFAAQVESLKWNAEKTAWVLTLKASSGFLWTDYDLLLAAGLPPDELHTEAQLRAMLTEQSRWIGAFE